jgi:hypothetical protein
LVIAWAFGQNGGFARKFTSIWRTGGSADSVWMAKFLITRPFSKKRHGRFRESDAPRHLFESVVQRCMAEGLVSADGFAVDASLIAADANKQRSVPSKDWKPEEIKESAVRAAREYLATLDDAAFGAASPVTPKFISRLIRRPNGQAHIRGMLSSPTPPTI